MAPPIVERICRDAGIPDLADVLADRLTASDLQSLLLEVLRRRGGARGAAELLAQRRRDPTVAAAEVDARRLHGVERIALEAAAGFEPVALAPVAPLGLNAVLGRIDQNNVLATARGSEVLADPTTAMALEAALRRRAAPQTVALCSVDRVLRLQPFPEGYTQHFGIFSLLTAGRARADHGFELDALREQLAVHLRLLSRLGEDGFDLASVTVSVSDSDLLRAIADARGVNLDGVRARAKSSEEESEAILASEGIEVPRFAAEPPAASGATGAGVRRRLELVDAVVFRPLREQFPDASFGFRVGRLRAVGYYDGLLLEITVATRNGATFSIADGGTTNWTRELLSNRKERLLVSAIGLEMLARFMAPDA